LLPSDPAAFSAQPKNKVIYLILSKIVSVNEKRDCECGRRVGNRWQKGPGEAVLVWLPFPAASSLPASDLLTAIVTITS